MNRFSNRWVWTALMFVILFGLQAPASAVPVVVVVGEDPGTTQTIAGITGFTTTGSDMADMIVTAFFGDVRDPIRAVWTSTGLDSGRALGSAVDADGNAYSFELTQAGDTFNSAWTLTNTSRATEVALTGILIDGFGEDPVTGDRLGDTVFDRTVGGGIGTPGSSTGHDFSSNTDFPFDLTVVATYTDLVAISGSNPEGDIFRYLDIRLRDGLFSTDVSLAFVADTDTIGLRPGVPEPGTLLLLGAGLVALYRRRHS